MKPKKVTPETEEYILENLSYDQETGHLWWTKPGGSRRQVYEPAGHWHDAGYREVTLRPKGKQTRCMSHRIAWFLYYNKWPENIIDHINGDKSDNRIENLREATYAENSANRKKTSIVWSHPVYIGVSITSTGKWISTHDGSRLGTFETPEEAARARDVAAIEKFGEFAKLNFPDG